MENDKKGDDSHHSWSWQISGLSQPYGWFSSYHLAISTEPVSNNSKHTTSGYSPAMGKHHLDTQTGPQRSVELLLPTGLQQD